MTEMHYWSIRELSQRIRSGEISPVAVVRTLLDRIEALDGRLCGFKRSSQHHVCRPIEATGQALLQAFSNQASFGAGS